MFRFLVFSIFFTLVLGECPQNSINLEDDPSICYSFHDTNTKFALAQLHCHSFGANLVAFQSDYVNVFVSQIASLLFNESESGYYWSGGHRLHDDSTFEWINGDEFNYTNFIHGQEVKKRGSCVSIQLEQGGWKIEDCFEEFPFVCQFDANQNLTPSNAVFIEKIQTPNIPDIFFTTILPPTTMIEKDENETNNTFTSQTTTVKPISTTLKSISITTTIKDFATVVITPMVIPTTTAPTTTSTTTTNLPPTIQTVDEPITLNTKSSSPSTSTKKSSSPLPTTTTTQSKTNPITTTTTYTTTKTTPTKVTTVLTSPSSKVQSDKPPTSSTTIKIPSSTITSKKVVSTKNPTTTKPSPKIIPTTTLKTTTTKTTTTTTQKSTTTTTTMKPLKSLTGWVNYNDTGFSYNLYDELMSFKAAEAACQNQGAHLASIHSYEENLWVYHMVKKFYKQNIHSPFETVAWLGYYKKDGIDFWTDKSVNNYSSWSEEVHKDAKQCGAMWTTYTFFGEYYARAGQWADRPCEEEKNFICKKAAAS